MNYKQTRICCYIAYISQAVAINFVPILFVIFHQTLSLSYAQIGLLTLVTFSTQILLDIFSVFFVDKIGFRKCATASQILCALGLFLLAVSTLWCGNAFLGIITATVVYSTGAGIVDVIVSPIIAALPQKNGSGAMIFLHSFYCWGQLLAVLVTTLALHTFGNHTWQIISVMWGIIPLVNSVAFCFVPFPKSESEATGLQFSVLKSKTVILIMLLMICGGASELAMSQWASAFAQEALGISKTVGDLLGPCLFAFFMAIGRTVQGMRGEKLNYEFHMIFNAILCAVCYFTAVFAKNPFVALMGCAVCGYSVSIMWPGVLSIMSDVVPNCGGAMFALAAVFGDVGCSVGSFITGVVASMTVFGDFALKAGLLVNIVYPLIFALVFGSLIKGIKAHRI